MSIPKSSTAMIVAAIGELVVAESTLTKPKAAKSVTCSGDTIVPKVCPLVASM